MIHEDAVVNSSVHLGYHVVVGADTVIDEGCVIGHGAVIEEQVRIGRGTRIDPGVVILSGTIIGEDCTISSGVVLGSRGFGFVFDEGEHKEIPQVGNVVIGDRVKIGSMTTIDRATIDSTIIEDDVTIGDHIQIGHNCHIKEGAILESQVGIAGSTTIGSRVKLGFKTGCVGHISLAEDIEVLPYSGVAKAYKKPGVVLKGAPALPLAQEVAIEEALAELPELVKKLEGQG